LLRLFYHAVARQTVIYEDIGKNLGLTKQRIGQLAKDFGVDGRQREHAPAG
jgi:hypothetical protein